jgi:hypothetical protein
MIPGDLSIESFAQYPRQARSFAVENLSVLKRMPLILLSVVLRQVIQYDWCFPAEREQLRLQFDLLRRTETASFEALMAPFFAIQLSPELRRADWINRPQQFSEQLTGYLWSQHEIDSYHKAAQDYHEFLQKTLGERAPATPRWTIVVIGQGSQEVKQPLFRKLAPHGTMFTQLDPADGLKTLVAEVKARTQQYPLRYGHWYIEGGEPHIAAVDAEGLTVMSYNRLVPVAKREFALLNQFTHRAENGGVAGAEAVSSYMAGLSPEDVDLRGTADDAPLRHFEVNLLTQGAGCQIFSTTFVQWASRECLHRAEPLTLFARFGTRQANAPMEQLLTRDPLQQAQDQEGSLVDADMGAYYAWINQSRLAGADQSRFLAWFEGHGHACAIAPALAQGTTSTASAKMDQLLDWMR